MEQAALISQVPVEITGKRKLDFFHHDSALFANFHAGFTAEALVFVYRFGFAVDEFVYINGAYIHAFGVTSALVFVNRNFEAHFFLH
jgi:hypothetical protein